MYRGDTISGNAMRELLNKKVRQRNGESLLPDGILERNFNDARDCFEKCYLEFQLSRNGGIISRTAEAIGIYPSNLHSKLRKYNIKQQTYKE